MVKHDAIIPFQEAYRMGEERRDHSKPKNPSHEFIWQGADLHVKIMTSEIAGIVSRHLGPGTGLLDECVEGCN